MLRSTTTRRTWRRRRSCVSCAAALAARRQALAYLFTIARNLCIDAARARVFPVGPLDVDVPDGSPDADPAMAIGDGEVGALVDALSLSCAMWWSCASTRGSKWARSRTCWSVAVRGEPAAQPCARGAAARAGRKGRSMSDVGKRTWSGCCGRTTAPSAGADEMSKAAALAACGARWRRSSGRAERGGRAGGNVGERSVRRRSPGSSPSGALSSSAYGWPSSRSWPSWRSSAPVERHGARHPGRLGHAGGGDGARGPAELLASAAPAWPNSSTPAASTAARSRWRGSSCWGVRTWDGHRHRARAPVMLGADPFGRLVHACVPYSSVRGRAARGAPVPLIAGAGAVVREGAAVIAGTYAAFSLVPMRTPRRRHWAWALVAAGSLGWAAHEVRTWIRGIEGGPTCSPRRLPDEPGDAGRIRNSTTL